MTFDEWWDNPMGIGLPFPDTGAELKEWCRAAVEACTGAEETVMATKPKDVEGFRSIRMNGMRTCCHYEVRAIREFLAPMTCGTDRQKAALAEICAATEAKLEGLLDRLRDAKTAKEIDAITWGPS